jgi:tyrosyl-tRNA synthetase
MKQIGLLLNCSAQNSKIGIFKRMTLHQNRYTMYNEWNNTNTAIIASCCPWFANKWLKIKNIS